METRDFTNNFLEANLVQVISYDTVLLKIDYLTGSEIKECKLFRISKSDVDSEYYRNVLLHLNSLITEKVKIKILNGNKHKSDINKEIVILYSDDTKHNINNQLLDFIKERNENNRMLEILNRLRKKNKE